MRGERWGLRYEEVKVVSELSVECGIGMKGVDYEVTLSATAQLRRRIGWLSVLEPLAVGSKMMRRCVTGRAKHKPKDTGSERGDRRVRGQVLGGPIAVHTRRELV